MAIAETAGPTGRKPLRVWPGAVAAALMVLVRLVVPTIVPEALGFGLLGGLACTLAIVIWWVFFSRARWSERLGAIALMIVAVVATRPALHRSIRTG